MVVNTCARCMRKIRCEVFLSTATVGSLEAQLHGVQEEGGGRSSLWLLWHAAIGSETSQGLFSDCNGMVLAVFLVTLVRKANVIQETWDLAFGEDALQGACEFICVVRIMTYRMCLGEAQTCFQRTLTSKIPGLWACRECDGATWSTIIFVTSSLRGTGWRSYHCY